jgi:hypothetical protein
MGSNFLNQGLLILLLLLLLLVLDIMEEKV